MSQRMKKASGIYGTEKQERCEDPKHLSSSSSSSTAAAAGVHLKDKRLKPGDGEDPLNKLHKNRK